MPARSVTTRSFALLAVIGLLAGVLPPAAAAAPAPTTAAPAHPRAGDPIPGQVIVKFKAGASDAQQSAARNAVGATARGSSHKVGKIARLEVLSTALPVAVATARLKGQAGVDYVEADRYVATDADPNDPLYPTQWGLENAGDHDIDASAAWSITTGSSNVVVAVIDTGVQLDHPDLAANIWHNAGEVGGNGVDDDGNGFVDDVNGWDFWDDDANPSDGNGHGTHVAGIVAARANNGIGVTGVAPSSRIMALRMLGNGGFGSISDGAAAIDYAWRNGARIANLSWGYSGGVSQVLSDAIALAGAHGMLVVAAAGNSSADVDTTPFYPAGLPSTSLVSVAATDDTDALWSGSNRGRAGVDLGAPGVAIPSTWLSSGYATLTGTSMASPHVAGVAALLLAANPTWTVTQLRVRLFQSVRSLPSLAGKTATGGIVNAADGLTGVADKPPTVTITGPATKSSFLPGIAVTLSATAVDPEDGDVGASITWTSSLQGVLGSGPSIVKSNLVPGDHVITAMAQDSAGHRPIRGIELNVGPTIIRIAGSNDDGLASVAVTAGGTPSVAWIRSGVGTFVATRAGSTWMPVLAVPSEDDRRVDLTIGPDGVPRAAIQRNWSSTGVFSDPGVILAEKSGSTWKTQRMTDSCTDGGEGCGTDFGPDLAYDTAGRPHIAVVRAGSTFGPSTAPVAVLHVWRTATGAIASETIHAAFSPAQASLVAGPDGVLHATWMEHGGSAAGVWYATNATGTWVGTRLASAGTESFPALVVDPSNRVVVAFRDAAGIRVRTRIGATWSTAPAGLIIPGTFGDVHLASTPDGKLHAVMTRTDASQTATGIVYATNASGIWRSTLITGNQAVDPSIAVDAVGAGHVHLAFRTAGASPAISYATNATGVWVVQSVISIADYDIEGLAVDGRGVVQAAVTRFGTTPGIYLGQRSGASWSLARVTTTPVDGGVGFATSSTGEAHLLYGTFLDAVGHVLADPAIYYATNASGSWKSTRLASNSGTSRRSLVLDGAGHVHVAFPGVMGGFHGIVYATNKTGAWVSTLIKKGNFIDPAIAVDAEGKIRIAARLTVGGQSRIESISNLSGVWTLEEISNGGLDFDPVIAIDPDGETSVAYWRDGGGVRLTERRGATWATRVLDAGVVPHRPQLRIDSTGLRHIFYGDVSLDYAICATPNCPLYPGLHEATAGDTGPFTVSRVSWHGNDVSLALDRGRDGRLSGAFRRNGVAIYEVILARPQSKVGTAIDDLSPPSIPHAGASTLSGRLHAGATNLVGRTLVFKIDGVQIGTALTNASGVASLAWTPTVAAGAHTLTIGFSGASSYLAARVGPRALAIQP